MDKNTLKQSSRRQFMDNMGKATLAASVIPIGLVKKSEMKGMFIHHVYFWLKKAGNKEDTAKLLEGLKKLSKVKNIQQFSIGVPAMSPRDVVDNSYAISWLCFFKNANEQADYQVDPIHLKFVQDYSHLWERVIVYDTIDA